MARRRKTYVINKSFQYRFVLYVCSWVCALSIIYPLVIFGLFDWFIDYLQPGNDPEVLRQISESKQSLIMWLGIMQLVFLGFLAFFSIIISHRIAGPLHKLKKAFIDAQEGKFTTTLKFRKHDHFMDLAEEFNEMMKSIQNKSEKR